MRQLSLVLIVSSLAFMTSGCDQKAKYSVNATGPSSASGQVTPGETYQEPTQTWTVSSETHLAKRQTDAKILFRDLSQPEIRGTYEDRISSGRIINLEPGTKVQIDELNVIKIKMLDGGIYRMRRGTILDGDEAGERGLIPEKDLRKS